MTSRRLLHLLLAAAPTLCACDPPEYVNCLLLSPECARGEAELRVDVINLAQDTRRITAMVDGVQRSTDKFKDGAASLYFFDIRQQDNAKVVVQVDAPQALQCNAVASTGKGTNVTVDMHSQDCGPVSPVEDAGAGEDAASPPDAAHADAGACHHEHHEDGGLCDGGCCDDDDGGY